LSIKTFKIEIFPFLFIFILPKITTLPLRKTGGKLSGFKKRGDQGPFHLTKPLAAMPLKAKQHWFAEKCHILNFPPVSAI
jgi:hypothetical protein